MANIHHTLFYIFISIGTTWTCPENPVYLLICVTYNICFPLLCKYQSDRRHNDNDHSVALGGKWSFFSPVHSRSKTQMNGRKNNPCKIFRMIIDKWLKNEQKIKMMIWKYCRRYFENKSWLCIYWERIYIWFLFSINPRIYVR